MQLEGGKDEKGDLIIQKHFIALPLEKEALWDQLSFGA